jgi:putative nucleotidyltransferase with HDIG domain
VAQVCCKIAARLGLPFQQVEGLELAALIHDIGKISVPSDILSKPSTLTDIEYELIKCHAAAGADLVAGIEFEWPIADIIRQHHERIDGSGYPQGLRGDEILLEAKIMAVADTFEAVSSHRPYRASLGVDKAVEILLEGRGKIFDEQVVDACVALVEAGELTEEGQSTS